LANQHDLKQDIAPGFCYNCRQAMCATKDDGIDAQRLVNSGQPLHGGEDVQVDIPPGKYCRQDG